MLSLDTIEACARAVGASVERVERAGGEWIARVGVASHDQKLRLLTALATAASEDYTVIQLARSIVRQAGARTDVSRAVAIHDWVKTNVWHVLEPVETFPDAEAVALAGIGDCDDAALLTMALCLAVCLVAALLPFGSPPSHVCAGVWLDGAWWPLETTIDAYPGEDPYDAADRLGVMRADLRA